jgi:hypothetical protein
VTTPRDAGLALAFALTCAVASAEPVEIQQGQEIGAGYSFRRGEACLVVTALHVVPSPVTDITVIDRSGARNNAQRSYDNPASDLALVEVAGKPTIACTDRWPDSSWLAAAKLSTRTQFEAVRHYPSGRETIVAFRFAGGTTSSLTLAPVDKTMIRESDSGTIVRLEDKLAGIVQKVDPATDRVEVLRFDFIDKLIGDRFRAAARATPVAVDGMFQHGRPNPNWSAFLRAWVSETSGRPVVTGQDAGARCRISVDVLEFRSVSVPNAEYEKASQQDCSLMRLFGKSAQARCEESKKNALRTAPRAVPGYAMSLEIKVTPRTGTGLSKLASGTVPTESGQRSRTADDQFNAMQALMAAPATELLRSGACD